MKKNNTAQKTKAEIDARRWRISTAISIVSAIVLPILTHLYDNRTINDRENTITGQRDSLHVQSIHIDSLNAKWQKFQNIMGVAIGGDVDSSIIIGNMGNRADDDAQQTLKELQELLK